MQIGTTNNMHDNEYFVKEQRSRFAVYSNERYFFYLLGEK